MLVDLIRARHEALRSALEALASLTLPPGARAARALDAVSRAFARDVPVWAAGHLAVVRALAGDDAGAVETRVGRLSPDELARLTTAIVELYTIASREYWTA